MAHHTHKFLFASLDLFALRDIQDHHQRVTSLLIDHGSRHQDRHATAVFAQILLFPGWDHSCREYRLIDLGLHLLKIWWHQLAPCDCSREEFFLAVANHLRETVIDFIDAPGVMSHCHPEDVGVHQRAQLAFAVVELLFQLTSPGHIAEDNHAPNDLARDITNRGAAEIGDEVFPLASAAQKVYSVCAREAFTPAPAALGPALWALGFLPDHARPAIRCACRAEAIGDQRPLQVPARNDRRGWCSESPPWHHRRSPPRSWPQRSPQARQPAPGPLAQPGAGRPSPPRAGGLTPRRDDVPVPVRSPPRYEPESPRCPLALYGEVDTRSCNRLLPARRHRGGRPGQGTRCQQRACRWCRPHPGWQAPLAPRVRASPHGRSCPPGQPGP